MLFQLYLLNSLLNYKTLTQELLLIVYSYYIIIVLHCAKCAK